MTDDRSDERDPPPSDCPAPSPQRSRPQAPEKPTPSTFENEWDEAPNTNTFRIPRS
jgi:hypothetical protein